MNALVTIVGDRVFEDNEYFTLTIADTTGAYVGRAGTILIWNDDRH